MFLYSVSGGAGGKHHCDGDDDCWNLGADVQICGSGSALFCS